MVLPFLLIGKALAPLAKVKKKGWKAMGNAFGQVKSAVNPMQSFSKILEVLSILMLPLTYIFTVLAAYIAEYLIGYIEDLVGWLEDLGDYIEDELIPIIEALIDIIIIVVDLIVIVIDFLGGFVTVLGYLSAGLDNVGTSVKVWTLLLPLVVEGFHAVINAVIWWGETWDNFWISFGEIMSAGFMGIIDNTVGLITSVYDAFEDMMNGILSLIPGDWGGGDDGDGDENPWYDPIGIFGSSSASSSSSSDITNTSSNTVNIDLRGAIVDDRDQLIRDISQEVIIRLG